MVAGKLQKEAEIKPKYTWHQFFSLFSITEKQNKHKFTWQKNELHEMHNKTGQS